ncbi:hypothetical protein Tco_0793276 [Tanacetum coccineum]
MPLSIKSQNDSFCFEHELKMEMHEDYKYVKSLEKEVDEIESKKADFSNIYDLLLDEVIHTTSVSRPQLKCYQVKDKVVPNNSHVKFQKKEVEDHHRIFSISKKTKSVTACNDSSNSRTSNENAVCAECGNVVTVHFGEMISFLLILGYGDSVSGNVLINGFITSKASFNNLFSVVFNSVINFVRLVKMSKAKEVHSRQSSSSSKRKDKFASHGLVWSNAHGTGVIKTRHSCFISKKKEWTSNFHSRTAEKNGVVEDEPYTLVEAAFRTMLSASKLPLSFWATFTPKRPEMSVENISSGSFIMAKWRQIYDNSDLMPQDKMFSFLKRGRQIRLNQGWISLRLYLKNISIKHMVMLKITNNLIMHRMLHFIVDEFINPFCTARMNSSASTDKRLGIVDKPFVQDDLKLTVVMEEQKG